MDWWCMQKLIEEGAVELVVPGVLPIGCFPVYLSIFRKQPEMYGRRSGCIRDLNTLSWVHNAALQRKIAELRLKHPGVRIMYADYYTPAIQFVLHAEKYGQCSARFAFVFIFFLSLFFFFFFRAVFFSFFFVFLFWVLVSQFPRPVVSRRLASKVISSVRYGNVTDADRWDPQPVTVVLF